MRNLPCCLSSPVKFCFLIQQSEAVIGYSESWAAAGCHHLLVVLTDRASSGSSCGSERTMRVGESVTPGDDLSSAAMGGCPHPAAGPSRSGTLWRGFSRWAVPWFIDTQWDTVGEPAPIVCSEAVLHEIAFSKWGQCRSSRRQLDLGGGRDWWW